MVAFYTTGIHAREWIAPATALYIVDKLIQGELPEGDFDNEVVDDLAWYILPVFNADGYAYTWDSFRLWRKTRSLIPDSFCVGVDGNRNFDVAWGGGGSSDDPCDGIYHGPEVRSEVEVQAVIAFLESIAADVILYQNLHSYGQYILLPYAHKEELPADSQDHQRLADAVITFLARL